MIFILGGSGYIGSEFHRCLKRRSIPHRSISRSDCDYCNADELAQLISTARPDFLINAAGLVGKPNVDACEAQRSECLQANAVLPGIVKRVCDSASLPWGHVSSGCIYSGAPPRETGFAESDVPNFTFRTNNCSFYAGSKALGEEIIDDANRCFIWRIRMTFSDRDSPRNCLSKLMSYPRLIDERNSLSNLTQCVDACIDCWTQQVEFGTYNVTNGGSVSTREIIQLIRASGVCEKEFQFFESDEQFVKATVAPRSNCVLDNRKALAAGLKLDSVSDALERSLRNWQPSSG